MFTHDCDNCKFLGTTTAGDWYACFRGTGTEIVRRFGNDGPEYSSLEEGIARYIPDYAEGMNLIREWRRKPLAPVALMPIPAPVKARKPRAPRAEKPAPIAGECGYVNPAWESDINAFGWDAPAARLILSVRNFRSEFRQSMRDQLVAWLDTPAADRKFRSPLSPRQWECIQPYDPRTQGRY